MFGDHSRVLPASMILPNEEVPSMTIWGGIPGAWAVRRPARHVLPHTGPLLVLHSCGLTAGHAALLAANPVGKVVAPEVSSAVEAARRKVLEHKDTVVAPKDVVAELQEVLQQAGQAPGAASGRLGRRASMVSFRVADPAAYAGASSNKHSHATGLAGTTFRVQAVPEDDEFEAEGEDGLPALGPTFSRARIPGSSRGRSMRRQPTGAAGATTRFTSVRFADPPLPEEEP